MQNPIGDKARSLAMQIREQFWEGGRYAISSWLSGRHGGDSVERGNQGGVGGTGVGFHSWRRSRVRVSCLVFMRCKKIG